jgi:hypothetical protein
MSAPLPPRRNPEPANPTRRYVPGTAIGGIGLAHVLDNKPWFTYLDIPRLARDPFISFLRRVWCSPLQGVKFKIKASSPEVANTVDKAVKKYWKKFLPAVMRRYFLYGYCPAGVEYRVKKGRWVLDRMRVIEPRDARVRIVSGGPQRGEFAGFDTESTGTVLRPYAFWFKGAGEFGGFYDVPPAANLWDAWTEYGTRGGARSLRQLYMRKHSISPAQLKYPEGETTWEDGNGATVVINNKDLAMQILEYYESGSNIVLPSGRDEKGNALWELIPAEVKAEATTVSAYPNELKEEMSEAVGMPFEVIKAAETGSGYSGRSVPYKAWLGTMDEYAGMHLDQFDDAPLRQLVYVNHGRGADYEIENESLVEQFEKMSQTTKDTGGTPPGSEPKQGDEPPPDSQPQPGANGRTPYTGPRGGKGWNDASGKPHYGDPFDMSQSGNVSPEAVEAAGDHEAKQSRNAGHLAAIAMLELQEQAIAEGDPTKYQDAMDELAALAKDHKQVKAVTDGEPFDMAWEPYSGPRGGSGYKDTETGRIRYQASRPGEHRERAAANKKKAAELVGKIRWGEGPEVHGHLQELVDHLPAMDVASLRHAREMLGARFGDAKKKTDMVDALKNHAMETMRANAEPKEPEAEPAPRKLAGAAAKAVASKKRADGTPESPRVDDVHTVDPKALNVDPERFQYKTVGIGKGGVSDELKGTSKWNPELGGTLLVWRDPANGKDYVINGHHRHELASRVGTDKVNVRYIDAGSAKEARARGALANIAEGRGTATDAAKYLRDSGQDIGHFKNAGISMSGKVAADASHLKDLGDTAFTKLAKGEITEPTAVAVAKHLKDPKLQDMLFKKLDRRAEDGKDWSQREVETAAKMMAQAGKVTEKGSDLFGDFEDEKSTFDQEVELRSHVNRALSQAVNDYTAVSNTGRAERVKDAGNQLAIDENQKRRDQAAGHLEDFEREAGLKSPISEALKTGAADLALAKTKKEKDSAKQRALEAVRGILEGKPPSADAGGSGKGGAGSPGNDRPAESAAKPKPEVKTTGPDDDYDLKLASSEEIDANFQRDFEEQRKPSESKPLEPKAPNPAHQPTLNDPIHKNVRNAIRDAQPEEGKRGYIADIHKKLKGKYTKEQINGALEDLEKNNWVATMRLDDPREITPERKETEIPSRTGGSGRHIFYRGTSSAGARPVYNDEPEESLAGTDLMGRPIPKKFGKAGGTQATMEDMLPSLWVDKAKDYAAEKGGKVEQQHADGRFRMGEEWYQVGKAEDGYPITPAESPHPKPVETPKPTDLAGHIADLQHSGISASRLAILKDPNKPLKEKLDTLRGIETAMLDKHSHAKAIPHNEYMRKFADFAMRGEMDGVNSVIKRTEDLIPALRKAGDSETADFYEKQALPMMRSYDGKKVEAPAPVGAAKKFFTTKEAADHLGMSERDFTEHHGPDLRGMRDGPTVRYKTADIEALKSKQSKPAEGEPK